MKLLMMLALVAMAGCASAPYETTTDRLKAECAQRNGEWTQFGCLFVLPFPSSVENDCVEAGGVIEEFGGCSVSVAEEVG